MPKKILIVDDEPEMLDLLKIHLGNNKYDIVSAMEGESCLKTAASEKPDIIILDLLLPGISGIEACRRLKENDDTKDIPIIMLTAAGNDMASKGLEKGAVSFITKPFDISNLLSKINAALKNKKIRRHRTK